MPTYRQILRRAITLAWRQKGLWFFGFLAIVLGSGGELDILRRSFSLDPSYGVIRVFLLGLIAGGQNGQMFLGFWQALKNQPLELVFALIILLLALAATALIIWLIVVGQGALINGIINHSKNKKTSFKENFAFGRAKFWPVFWIHLVNQALLWFLLATFGTVFLAALRPETAPGFIILLIILSGLIVSISLIARYALLAVVVKNRNFRQAWNEAFGLLQRHWLVSLEIAGLVFVGFWLVNTTLVVVISLGLFYTTRWFHSLPVLITGINIAALLLFVVGQIILTLFHWTTWSLTFVVLDSKKAFTSRIGHGLEKILKR